MSRREVYTCDVCGNESADEMKSMIVFMEYGGLCMVKKAVGSMSTDTHVCRTCAESVKEDINETMRLCIPRRLQNFWKE